MVSPRKSSTVSYAASSADASYPFYVCEVVYSLLRLVLARNPDSCPIFRRWELLCSVACHCNDGNSAKYGHALWNKTNKQEKNTYKWHQRGERLQNKKKKTDFVRKRQFELGIANYSYDYPYFPSLWIWILRITTSCVRCTYERIQMIFLQRNRFDDNILQLDRYENPLFISSKTNVI